MFWTIEDVNSGLCSVSEVGTKRPPAPPEPPPPVDPDLSFRQQLKNDAPAAYAALGGVEFLKANPDILAKMVIRSLPPEGINDPNKKADEIQPMPWISAQRLAYRMGQHVLKDIAPTDDSPWLLDPPELREMVHAFLTAHPELYRAAELMVAKMEALPKPEAD